MIAMTLITPAIHEPVSNNLIPTPAMEILWAAGINERDVVSDSYIHQIILEIHTSRLTKFLSQICLNFGWIRLVSARRLYKKR